jgi:hypothetical protein
VVAAPEVDTTTKDWPRSRARVPCVRVNETGVGSPHDLLQLPELAEETGVTVVDLFGIFLERRMLVALNVPDAVGKSAALCAGDFLLLEAPVRKLDFVREQYTAGHEVDKLELGLNSSQALLGFLTVRH